MVGGSLRESARLVASGGKRFNMREVGGLGEVEGEGVTAGEIGVAKNCLDGAHLRDRAGKHDLNRSFDDGIFQRRNDADVREIAFVVGVADGIVLAEGFEQDLVGDGAVKGYAWPVVPG